MKSIKNIHWRVENMELNNGPDMYLRAPLVAKVYGYLKDPRMPYVYGGLSNVAEEINSRLNSEFSLPEIKKVIFNDPVTVVLWMDGTKTVVRSQPGDYFDPEKGLTMAITKKAMGNNGSYYNEIKKWLPVEKQEVEVEVLEPEK